jgi:hypothetical protein
MSTIRNAIHRAAKAWAPNSTRYLNARIDELSGHIDDLVALAEAQQNVIDALSDQVDLVSDVLLQHLKRGKARGKR